MLENVMTNLKKFIKVVEITAVKNSIKTVDIRSYLFGGDLSIFTRDSKARILASTIDRNILNLEIQSKLLETARKITLSGVYICDNELINKIIKVADEDAYYLTLDYQKMKDIITMAIYYNNSAEVLMNAIEGNVFFDKSLRKDLTIISNVLENYIQMSYEELKGINNIKR